MTPGFVPRKGVVDLAHVVDELMQMAKPPQVDEPVEERELKTVNVMGATRTIPQTLDPSQRDARLARADARRAARASEREAIHELIHHGEAE